MYEGHDEAAHYYGCITELDEQVGRIRKCLEDWGVADNTLLCFCSDNGPEGKAPEGKKAGVTAGLRGRKRSLYDGGVRVPALAVWSGKIEAGSVVDTPCSTLDYFPMVANLTSFKMPDDRPIDGQDLMPILTGQIKKRDNAIPFRSRSNATLVIDRYKLVLPAGELYNLTQDWSEENDIASDNWERVQNMSRELMSYLESMQKSHAGDDYNDPSFKPLDEWTELKTNQNK
jgi:arylsulfatase A-like enzyme